MRTVEEEIGVVDRRDAAVDDRARLRVAIAVRVLRFRWEEPLTDALRAHQDRQLGPVRLLRVELSESIPDLWHLVKDDRLELTLRENEHGEASDQTVRSYSRQRHHHGK